MLRRSICTCTLAALMISALPLVAADPNRESTRPAAQPDKILYDKGLDEIQKKHFEQARLLLSTLINTYGASDYAPKAELAVAESWFQQGGAHGLDRAQQECAQLMQRRPDSPEAKQASELLRKIQESTSK